MHAVLQPFQQHGRVARSHSSVVVLSSRTRDVRAFQKGYNEILKDDSGNITSVKLFSPSKINWTLLCPFKRDDGYHEIHSIVQVLNFGDRMEFSPIEGAKDELECNDEDVPTDDSNLIIKALQLYRDKTGSKQHFKVVLDKRVPMGAGLGGGSGNAATALYGANVVAGKTASNADLKEWSADIGSDIPFFFSETGCAFMAGRGEKIADLPALESRFTPILLVKPPQGLSTKDVYGKYDLRRKATMLVYDVLIQYLNSGKFQQHMTWNDLEEPAFALMPELRDLKNLLFEKAPEVRCCFMSGSGSTVVVVGAHALPEESFPQELYKDYMVHRCNVTSRPNSDVWYDYGPNEPSESPANNRWTYHHHTRMMYGDTAVKRYVTEMLNEMGIDVATRQTTKRVKDRVDEEVLVMRQTESAKMTKGTPYQATYAMPGDDPLDMLKRAYAQQGKELDIPDASSGAN